MIDISIKNLTVYYDDFKALDNINLDIYKNDFLAIIGPNGGGKSTLIKSMVGLIKYQKGSIYCNEEDVGYVPQHANFDKGFPISVREVIMLGALNKNIKPFTRIGDHYKQRADMLIDQLNLSDIKDKEIGNLSGGQFQKVLIARAMIKEPRILVLDEPTSSIDPESKGEIFKILKGLNDEVTIIVVTHDVKDIYPYINSMAMIDRTLIESKRTINKDSKEFFDLCGCRNNFYTKLGR